jgi:BON domain-containing protein
LIIARVRDIVPSTGGGIMNDTTAFVAGAALGAGLMYALDPDRGRRRRALARDKIVHLVRKGDTGIGARARDVGNRAAGVVAETRARFRRERTPDEQLAARVREKLGHYCSHPRAVEVSVSDGRVMLTGAILSAEVAPLLVAVDGVRGVRGVDNRLDAHARADVPPLQGGRERPAFLRSSWSPGARLLTGTASIGLLAACAARRDLVGHALGLAGLGLLAHAATNVGVRRPAQSRPGPGMPDPGHPAEAEPAYVH